MSLLYGLYAVAAYFLLKRLVVPGWASTILVVTFLGGANLLALGLIGQYIASMFEEIKSRPIYIVDSASMPNAGERNVTGG